MNIKDFLMEHYIYIIIVIVLTIITIIGFLADKKKNSEKRPKTMSGTINNGQNLPNMTYQQPANMNQPVNYQPVANMPNNSMTYQQPQNNIPNVQVQQDIQPMPNNMPVNPIPQVNVQMPNQVNEMSYNTLQPVEPLSPNIVPQNEPMYQPLSEQKPTFAPVEPNVVNNMSMPQMNNQPNVVNNIPVEPVQNVIPQPVMPQPDPYMANQLPNGPMPQMNNQPMPMPNMNNNPMPNQITPPQPVSPQQINFVYGGGNQNNNGGYMQ